MMFQSFEEEERNSILALSIASLPFEDASLNYLNLTDRREQFISWSDSFVSTFTRELQLTTKDSLQYLPLVPKQYFQSQEEREESDTHVNQFVCNLRTLSQERHLAAQILISLLEIQMYDSRGSVLFRKYLSMLCLAPQEVVWLTSQLACFLARRFEEIAHRHNVIKDKYRLAKIGAVAAGAGALVLFTAGLAAPAVAGALIVLGTSSVAAAGITGAIVLAFGGTAAGLAGYKMSNRTRGLTDFEFKQYDEKGKMEVMVMVSGWMEEDEDDKRTFGVLPDQMSLKERLSRFYKLHDPSRLCKVENEANCFQEDPEALFDQLREQYGKDPTEESGLIPVPLDPPDGTAVYATLFADCYERLVAGLTEAPVTASLLSDSHKNADPEFTFSTIAEPIPQNTEHAETSASNLPIAAPVLGNNLWDDGDSRCDSPALAGLMQDAGAISEELREAAAQQTDGKAGDKKEERGPRIGDIRLFDQYLFWHWRELTVSPMYELTLLHWERQLQKTLGRSILNLNRSVSSYAAGASLQLTLFGALAASVALPMNVMHLADAIDNVWLVAAERAEVAGKEMAKALLLRPHGSRPVTLVGYSMGCRVLFSCLKELARRLKELEDPGGLDLVNAGAKEQHQEAFSGDSAPPVDASKAQSGSFLSSMASVFRIGTKQPLQQHAGESSAGENAIPAESSVGESRAEGVSREKQQSGEVRTVRELRGLIKDVVLLGAPLNLKSRSWPRVRRVVSGRLINGYSTLDVTLAVVYRYQRYKIGVSGVAPVPVAGVENVNLKRIVTQHIHYSTKMKQILEELNLASALPHPDAKPPHWERKFSVADALRRKFASSNSSK